MDGLILDAEVLMAVASAIESYCQNQNQILDQYYASMSALASEWDDDETFGQLLREVQGIKAQAQEVMEQIRGIYPSYFRKKAGVITDRPIYVDEGTAGMGFVGAFDSATYNGVGFGGGSSGFAGSSSGASVSGTGAPSSSSTGSSSTSAPTSSSANPASKGTASSTPKLEKGEFISDGIRPTKLNRTRQTWQRDGYVKTFNTPKQTGEKLNSNQGVPVSRGGEGVEGFEGTCGLVSVENILRMAGVNITEEKVVNYARTHKIIGFKGIRPMCTIDSSPENNGGTYAKDRQAVLRHFGIESDIEYGSVEKIAEYVEQGRGVIATVDANMLWYQSHGSVPAFHAITITSIQRDAHTNEITGVYVCDSGDRGESSARLVPVEVMRFALAPTGAEMNITKTIIR
ncbi:MAG: C39 family peptidase [Clostridia bacterium]|nr:C39 family peptidase [Clostridia bacterium]